MFCICACHAINIISWDRSTSRSPKSDKRLFLLLSISNLINVNSELHAPTPPPNLWSVCSMPFYESFCSKCTVNFKVHSFLCLFMNYVALVLLHCPFLWPLVGLPHFLHTGDFLLLPTTLVCCILPWSSASVWRESKSVGRTQLYLCR